MPEREFCGSKATLQVSQSHIPFQAVRLLVPVHQRTFNIGSPVQDPAAYLDIGQYAVVAVILKAPAADLQSDGQFLVGIIAFPVQGRLVVFTYFLYLFR